MYKITCTIKELRDLCSNSPFLTAEDINVKIRNFRDKKIKIKCSQREKEKFLLYYNTNACPFPSTPCPSIDMDVIITPKGKCIECMNQRIKWKIKEDC